MTVAAMGAMARVYLTARRQPDAATGWTLPAIFWSAVAGGVMLKGPLILMFIGLPAVTLTIADRSARWLKALRPLAGIVWVIVVVLPWLIAIVSRAGGSFFEESLGHDMLAKVTSGQEAHGAPPGYYLLLYWVTFWPGAVLTGAAVPTIWKARREPGAQFLLAWLIPSWLVFEAVMTKLPHYVLPLYPVIAILIAGIVERRRSEPGALDDARHCRLVSVSAGRRGLRPSSALSPSAAISACSPGRSRRRR